MVMRSFWAEETGSLAHASLRVQAQRYHAAHQPPLTLDAWQTQRAHLQAHIRQQIGSAVASCPLEMREHGEIALPTHRIKMITYQSRPGFRVTGNLYLPHGQGPFPGLLAVHGHWLEGRVAPRVQSRCHLFASEGYVVLAVDAFGAGERGVRPGTFTYHGGQVGASLFNIGETLLGMQVQDNIRAIDLLQSLDCVDGERIGVTGASGGGNQTMWVAALDARVKAAVPVVSVGTFESYVTERNCVCETLPDGLPCLEEWAVLGMIAPNALLMLNALRDTRTFSVQEMLRSYAAAREVYRLFGETDRIAYQAFDLPHGYWPEMKGAALGWFNRWLKGIGEGRPCEYTEIAPLPYQQLLCFPEGDRPADVQSIYDFSRSAAVRLAAEHRHATSAVSRAEKTRALAAVLRLPADGPVGVSPVREVTDDDLTARSFRIEVEPGMPLPVEVYSQAGTTPAHAILVVHHEGKESIPREPWMQEALAKGQALAFVELRHTGAMGWDHLVDDTLTRYHDASRAVLWLGQTMIGAWTSDLMTVAEHLKTCCGVQTLDLLAYRDAGIAALCAAALSEQFGTVTTRDTLASYVPGQQFFSESMAIHIPGILAWGDLSMMAALANAHVCLVNPTHGDGERYTAEEIAELEREIAALTHRLGGGDHVAIRCEP